MNPRTALSTMALTSITLLNAMILHTDGLIKVKGGNWRDVRITVVPEFSTPFEVALTGPHFKLDLPLFANYLLRAEHPGSPAKAIVFDLTVPEHLMDVDFEFPFEVQLELTDAQDMFSYAGPVGIISFNTEKKDFTYSTDYTRIQNVRALPEMELAMTNMVAPIAIADVRSNDSVSEEVYVDDMHELSSKVDVEPQMMAFTQEFGAQLDRISIVMVDNVDRMPVLDEAPEFSVRISPNQMVNKKTIADSTAFRPSKNLEHDIVHNVDLLKGPKELNNTIPEQCGTHEFIQQPRYLIIIDRFAGPSGCTELRRVTHAFGTTYYFINGSPVTDVHYTSTLQQAQASGDKKEFAQN